MSDKYGLTKRIYTRLELEEVFQTTRMDSVKRSLKRAGYKFTSSGPGDTYTIKITELPEKVSPFQSFIMQEFGCAPQTNFQAMQKYFCLLFYDLDYQFLPSNHQAQKLEEIYKITISDQTLRNWKKLLLNKNWIAQDEEKVRYLLCRRNELPREITKEEFAVPWKEFYARKSKGENQSDLLREISCKLGGMPRKQVGFTENALEKEKLEILHSLLLENE